MALYKNRYIHRTSIQPSAALRERELHMKLAIIHEYVKDKRVVLIDDSIVTGTTLRKIVAMVRAAGAREVHVRISSPPIVCYDPYSINQQDETKLIAAHKTIGQVGESLGADSLGYLSYGGMIRATGLPESTFRTVCFTKKQAHHTAEAAILPRH
jgi:amidophosphoribosyltransferase